MLLNKMKKLTQKEYIKLTSLVFMLLPLFMISCYLKVNAERQNGSVDNTRISQFPDIRYEFTKRKFVQDVKEFVWYLELQLEKLSTNIDIETLLAGSRDRKNALLSKLSDISKYDGYDTWRAVT